MDDRTATFSPPSESAADDAAAAVTAAVTAAVAAAAAAPPYESTLRSRKVRNFMRLHQSHHSPLPPAFSL